MTATIDAIRKWELNAGESFTDYFLDQYSYIRNNGENRWIDFLVSKGYKELAFEIEEDSYMLNNGKILECSDQELKFEPYTQKAYDDGIGWNEETYRKDVALWAEFINEHSDILAAYECFIGEDDE
jgi:hypothetical protein